MLQKNREVSVFIFFFLLGCKIFLNSIVIVKLCTTVGGMISWLAGFQASMAHFLPVHRSYSGGELRTMCIGKSYRYPFILQFCLPYKFKNILAIKGLILEVMNLLCFSGFLEVDTCKKCDISQLIIPHVIIWCSHTQSVSVRGPWVLRYSLPR
jgi:hypothetical protein